MEMKRNSEGEEDIGCERKRMKEMSVDDRERDGMRGFEYLDHPADVLLHAWGRDEADAMGALLESLYGVLTDREAIQEVYSYETEAEGEHEQALIFNTLQEALYAFQAEPYFVGRRVEVLELGKGEDGTMRTISVRAYGESFDTSRHMQKSDVKAPTYSNMQIQRRPGRVDLFVVVDV